MESFTIPYSRSVVDDLKKRLQSTRWPDEVPGSGWNHGTELSYLKELCSYWETQTINSSMRHYYHNANNVNLPTRWPGGKIRVPTGIAMVPGEKDLIIPREFAERSYNIRHWTNPPRGGHFAAIEEPDLLVQDIRTFNNQLHKRS